MWDREPGRFRAVRLEAVREPYAQTLENPPAPAARIGTPGSPGARGWTTEDAGEDAVVHDRGTRIDEHTLAQTLLTHEHMRAVVL